MSAAPPPRAAISAPSWARIPWPIDALPESTTRMSRSGSIDRPISALLIVPDSVPATWTETIADARALGNRADLLLDGPQPCQRNEGDEEQHDGRTQDAVDPEATTTLAADEAAGDLAQREEDRIEAHDSAAVRREGLGHVGEQAQCRGRRAREHEEPAGREEPVQRAEDIRLPLAVVDQRRGRDAGDAAADPV